MKKRIISAAMCLAMLLSLLPVSAFAAGEATSVVAANLTAVAGKDGPAFGQAKTYTATIAEKAITVTATGLQRTKNAEGATDYWVGVGLPVEAGAKYAWNFGTYDSNGTFTPNANQPATGGSRTQAGTTGNGVVGTNYTTFYWSPNTNKTWNDSESKNGYIAVQHTDQTVTVYTITFNVTVADPTIAYVGYRDVAASAKDQIKADMDAMKDVTDSSAGSDADAKTMWVTIRDLPKEASSAANYKLIAKGPDGSELALKTGTNFTADGPGATFNTDTGFRAIWWSFNQDATGGTVVNKPIESGTYTFEIHKKGNDGSFAKVGEAATLKIAKLTVKVGSNTTEYFVDVTSGKSLTEQGINIAVGGGGSGGDKVFRGWKINNTGDPTTLPAKISEDTTVEAVFEDKADLLVQPVTDNITDLGNMAPAKLGSITKIGKATAVAGAEKKWSIEITGESNFIIWDAFSSVPEQKAGNYVALKLTSETTENAKIKIVSPTEGEGGLEKTLDSDGILVLNLNNFGPDYQTEVKVYESNGTTLVGTYVLNLSGVTRKPVPALKVEVLPANDSTTVNGQKLVDLADITVTSLPGVPDDDGYILKTLKVNGTSKYAVLGSAFSSVAEQQQGNYIALKLTTDLEGAVIKIKSPSEGDIAKVVDPSDHIALIRLQNFEGKKLQAGIFAGEENETVWDYYEIDLSGVECEAASNNANISAVSIGAAAIGEIPTAGTLTAPAAITATFPANAEAAALNNATVVLTVDPNATVKTSTSTDAATAPADNTYNGAQDNDNGAVTINSVDLSSGKALYVMVTAQDGTTKAFYKITAEKSVIAVADVATTVPNTDAITDATDKTAVSNAGTKTTVESGSEATLQSAALAKADADTTVNERTAESALKAPTSGVTFNEGDTASIYVVPSVKVEAKTLEKDEAGQVTSYTVNITPIATVYATTGDVTTPGDVVLPGAGAGSGTVNSVKMKEIELKNPGAVSVKIGVPSGLASENDQVYIIHHSSNGPERYLRTVTSGNVVTVTIGDFSDFTLTKATEPVLDGITLSNGTLSPAFDTAVTAYNVSVANSVSSITVTPNVASGLTATVKVGDATMADGVVPLSVGANTIKIEVSGVGTAKTYTITVTRAAEDPGTGGGGGGSSATVTAPSTNGGKVSISNSSAKKGDTVTITATPDTGKIVGTVTVTDKNGNNVTVTDAGNGKYTFVMPDTPVTVKVTFVDKDENVFTDVDKSAYYADAVKWAVEKGITNGLTATTFGPNNSCTRGQMVTFLWRAAGSPAATGTNSFSDVASGEYYYNAVLWAVEKGITNGTSATTFSPNATVNRGQTVTFLYRYAESPAATGDTSFTDVTSDAFYADAVKWAVAEEITNGTSSTTFSPASNCTRGQIVTFMYRQMAE